MHGTTLNLPAQAGQVSPSLQERAAEIRTYHAAVVAAFGSAVEYAIKCGTALTNSKKQTGHGQWLDFLRACDVGERQAQRYMKLAELAEGKSDFLKSDLNSRTIEGAIKFLTPPKAGTGPSPTGSARAVRPLLTGKLVRSEKSSEVETDSTEPTKSTDSTEPTKSTTEPAKSTEFGPKSRPTKRTDIIAAWLAAAPADRTKAIDAIGLNALWAAIPEAWLPLLEKRLAERHQVAPKPAVDHLLPADGSIPAFMIRPTVKVVH